MLYLQCDRLVYNQYVNRGHELTIFINPILTLYLNYISERGPCVIVEPGESVVITKLEIIAAEGEEINR